MSDRRRRRCIGIAGVGMICGVRGALSARDVHELREALANLQDLARREEAHLRTRWVAKLCRLLRARLDQAARSTPL